MSELGQAPPAPPSTPSPAGAPQLGDARPSFFSRFFGALFSPDETFASIARRPDFVAPMIVLLLLALGGGAVMANRVDFTGPAREKMEEKKVPADRIDSQVRMIAAVSKVAAYCAPIFTILLWLLSSAILLLAFRMMGGEGTYGQAYSTTLYAYIPRALQSVIVVLVIFLRGGTVGAAELPTIVKSNLAFLVSQKATPMLFAVASAVDVFALWSLVLSIIGFAYVSRFSRAKSAAIVITVWLLGVLLIRVAPAALSGLGS
jgi:hypothetical protein